VSDDEPTFAFVQFDFAGRLGLDEGRYVVRGGEALDRVLVITELTSAPARGRRRRRSRPAETAAPEVPLTRATVIDSERLEDEAASSRWLRAAGDEEERGRNVADAARVINAALHAEGAATQDPYVHEVSPARALVVRIGVGSGDEVADGRWSHAIEVPGDDARRRRRAEDLRPQERVAAVLGGRERIDACETLLLRARADLDAGRTREAAMQLRLGLDALLAELSAGAGPGQAEDLALLERRRAEVERAGADAFREPPAGDRLELVADTLRVCERVLRRRRLRG
jgi:hypothetical protein